MIGTEAPRNMTVSSCPAMVARFSGRGVKLCWIAVVGIFILDLFVIRNGWCGHLCPLGAFYALLGRCGAQLSVDFDASSCTHCAECATICPEPQVLNLKKLTRDGTHTGAWTKKCVKSPRKSPPPWRSS